MPLSCSKISTVVYTFIIFVELSCGLVATFWTAFWNDKEVDKWAYIIFGIDIAFAFILLYFTSYGIYSRWKQIEKTVSQKRLCIVCTMVTFFILTILYYYNKTVLQDCNLDGLSWVIFWTFLLSYLALVGVSIYLVWNRCTTAPVVSNDNHHHHDIEEGEMEPVEMLDIAEASHSSEIGEGAIYLKKIDQVSINSSQSQGECL
ncbi:unnamed protein product [Orchesella dallaii]|uniref:Transmembrane protein n=1 Tax=Orchesella dallaii TaxID=48710 RepID=A0ABP1RVN0_9HEXA